MNILKSTVTHIVSIVLSSALLLSGAVHAGPTGLLGVQIGYPQTNFNSSTGQGTMYDGTTLTITSSPVFTTFTAGGMPGFMSGTPSLEISAAIDSAGTLSGGTFVMTGQVTDPTSGITYSGTLLSGTVVDYGISDIGGPGGNDLSDFRLAADNGTMLGLYGGAEIGVIVTLEGSSFSGSFATTFGSTRAKGDLGPIPAPGGDPDPGGDPGGDPTSSLGTGTIGYWKNHPGDWPVYTVMGFSQNEALSILKTPSRGDKSLTMAKQLIATYLNIADGNDSSCIDDTVAVADAWLADHGGVGSGQRSWDGDGDLFKDDLDAYNNGLLCAPHR
jgi:hypothetical protein